MPNKMLIDASHPEETRVVVTRGSRIEEFDFESQDKKQLKGNIYLARVTRVEPSLQAAFIEYGGNRHGFLAFSEIHPDYYQIPVADRQAILRAEAQAAEEDDEDDEDERAGRRGKRRGRGRGRDGERETSRTASSDTASDQSGPDAGEQPPEMAADSEGSAAAHVSDVEPEPAEGADVGQSGSPDRDEAGADENGGDGKDDDGKGGGRSMAAATESDSISETYTPETGEERGPAEAQPAEHDAGEAGGRGEVEEVGSAGGGDDESEVESVGAEDALEELPSRRRTMRKQYKIQEVIKRRQILLVQVVKEERGNKGAALTTYLSLAGRYSVLMPNTARGGGISRKITSAPDRKRLKDVVKDLDVPQGMGVILRTAGANRTKPEIKRDYEYLMRMWENVRTLTLQSTAPALVYEEGSLIKRSVRDLYNKDIEEILVAGEEGYREAKDFMRMLMPSHAKMVQPYRDVVPIFARNGIEAQLDRMLQPQVTLKSGGYIVINQTEALVSIDVNSGRSTREHSIEDTALQTNLEAAEEVARQLRLRDLAGLIVIDFIDMEENRNNRSVEKRMKDCLKNDRARIQVGRISHFGLLEMSRQRIRSSVLESTTQVCPHCGGTGHIRSESSVALHVVRAIEEFLLKDNKSHITVRTPTATALYVLNQKRRNLTDLEARFGVTITIEADDTLGKQHHLITRGAAIEKPVVVAPVTATTPEMLAEDEADEAAILAEEEEDEPVAETPRSSQARSEQPRATEQDGDAGRKRKRRRRRRGGRDRDRPGANGAPQGAGSQVSDDSDEASDEDENGPDDAIAAEDNQAEAGQAGAGQADGDAKKRRRGKRGGRRNRGDEASDAETGDAVSGEAGEAEADAVPDADEATAPAPVAAVEEDTADEAPAAAPVKPRRAPRARGKSAAAAEVVAAAEETSVSAPPAPAPAVAEAAPQPEAAPEPEAAEKARPARRRSNADDLPAGPVEAVVTSTGAPAEGEEKPKKAGWWQRRGFF